jgi:hypothetical protein
MQMSHLSQNGEIFPNLVLHASGGKNFEKKEY